MNLKITYDEAKFLLNALDSKVVFIEDFEDRDPLDALPYRALYQKVLYLINREEVN